MSGGSCRDLRKYQDDPAVQEAFGRILTGRSGYKPVVERRKETIRCKGCQKVLEGEERFCPECGTKVEKVISN